MKQFFTELWIMTPVTTFLMAFINGILSFFWDAFIPFMLFWFIVCVVSLVIRAMQYKGDSL